MGNNASTFREFLKIEGIWEEIESKCSCPESGDCICQTIEQFFGLGVLLRLLAGFRYFLKAGMGR